MSEVQIKIYTLQKFSIDPATMKEDTPAQERISLETYTRCYNILLS